MYSLNFCCLYFFLKLSCEGINRGIWKLKPNILHPFLFFWFVFGNQIKASGRFRYIDHIILPFCTIILMKLLFDLKLSACIEVYHQEFYETSSLLCFTARMLLKTLFSMFPNFIKTHSTNFSLDLIPIKIFFIINFCDILVNTLITDCISSFASGTV